MHSRRDVSGLGFRALTVMVVSLAAVLWGGALQGAAQAVTPQGPRPDTTGA